MPARVNAPDGRIVGAIAEAGSMMGRVLIVDSRGEEMNLWKLMGKPVVAAGLVALAAGPASAFIHIGDTLDIQYNYPGLGIVFSDSGNFIYTGPGQSVLIADITTLILGGNSVVFANNIPANIGQIFFTVPYNGPVLIDVSNGSAFSGWGVTSATAAYTSALLTSSEIGVNFSGQTYTGGAVTIAGAVPEPAVWTMMLVGIGGLGAALRSRGRAATT
jgi:PEP-CTERM motif